MKCFFFRENGWKFGQSKRRAKMLFQNLCKYSSLNYKDQLKFALSSDEGEHSSGHAKSFQKFENYGYT